MGDFLDELLKQVIVKFQAAGIVNESGQLNSGREVTAVEIDTDNLKPCYRKTFTKTSLKLSKEFIEYFFNFDSRYIDISPDSYINCYRKETIDLIKEMIKGQNEGPKFASLITGRYEGDFQEDGVLTSDEFIPQQSDSDSDSDDPSGPGAPSAVSVDPVATEAENDVEEFYARAVEPQAKAENIESLSSFAKTFANNYLEEKVIDSLSAQSKIKLTTALIMSCFTLSAEQKGDDLLVSLAATPEALAGLGLVILKDNTSKPVQWLKQNTAMVDSFKSLLNILLDVAHEDHDSTLVEYNQMLLGCIAGVEDALDSAAAAA